MFILTSEIQKQINMSKFFVGLVDGETTETPHLQGPVTGLSLHLGKSYLWKEKYEITPKNLFVILNSGETLVDNNDPLVTGTSVRP